MKLYKFILHINSIIAYKGKQSDELIQIYFGY